MSAQQEEADRLDKIIGGRVRARRVFQGTSQTEVGEAIGVTFQQVQKYESGTNRISSSMLILIANKLAVQAGYFLQGLGEKDAGDFAEIDLSADAIKIARRFDAIGDPYVKDIALRTLSAFERLPGREVEQADG